MAQSTSSSSSSSINKFDIFEFNEEDENVEKVSQKMIRKSPNLKRDYAFLRPFRITRSMTQSSSINKFTVFDFDEKR
ncbi:hypothetical protein L195_g057927 [Trifolium pratense]|uniref:Uncharacterized protein n=1 Tax=Trifolium pratense TaxID=57577 RepID=A0A2K3KUK3_TRIPR|nr:hypothetical protein L195_g057005 [Trifolium pratense]PNX70971.1 hypothetical protein L195_g057927 [Trifolium pratense]